MINIILFLFPAGLSLKIKDDYFKEKLNMKDYLLTFIKYALIINLIVFGILFIYFMGTVTSISYATDNINFIFKYLIIAIFISLFVPIIDEYFKKSFHIKINFKKANGKNVKKNRK